MNEKPKCPDCGQRLDGSAHRTNCGTQKEITFSGKVVFHKAEKSDTWYTSSVAGIDRKWLFRDGRWQPYSSCIHTDLMVQWAPVAVDKVPHALYQSVRRFYKL